MKPHINSTGGISLRCTHFYTNFRGADVPVHSPNVRPGRIPMYGTSACASEAVRIGCSMIPDAPQDRHARVRFFVISICASICMFMRTSECARYPMHEMRIGQCSGSTDVLFASSIPGDGETPEWCMCQHLYGRYGDGRQCQMCQTVITVKKGRIQGTYDLLAQCDGPTSW